MTSLVVVESPAKCKKIQSYLGPGFRVIASMGHIRALEEDLDALGIDRGWKLRYTFLKEKSKALGALKEAAANATQLYLAADDDREGEAIAYSVAVFLRRDPLSLPRIVFHEITPTAIKKAVANPRCIDMNKVNAQQARAVLDMLVGFTISPLLWKSIAPKLSAGRCQTPALRLVCDRETAISSHVATTTWTLKAAMKLPSSDFTFDATMTDELEDQESTMNYLENIHSSPTAVIAATHTGPWSISPPKPLITSSLQQEASALYKLGPKATMRSAQSLYESGHITYMRTDSIAMSDDAVKEGRAHIQTTYGSEYLGILPNSSVSAPKQKGGLKDAEGTPKPQEAHECIRPTHMDRDELPTTEDWSPIDKKIYTLIYRRALQSLMASVQGKQRTITMTLPEDPDAFQWRSQWKLTTFPGWKLLGATAQLDDTESDEENGNTAQRAFTFASSLKEGDTLNWTSIKATPKVKKAAPRFTEATLIRELESKGIGRPSTFASLVETLLDKQYVEKKDIPGQKLSTLLLTLAPTEWPPTSSTTQSTAAAEKQKLVPTPLGTAVAEFCTREFPDLFAYSFTATMEQNLDSVAKGDVTWESVCDDTWNSYKERYSTLKSAKPSATGNSNGDSAKQRTFSAGLKAIMSKKGPLLLQESEDKKPSNTVFYSFPPNTSFTELTEEKAREWIATQKAARGGEPVGTFEGKPILRKKGPYGEYLECGSMRIPYIEDESDEKIAEKFRTKKTSDSNKRVIGAYTFTSGPYGPYMFKTALKTKIFVKIPTTLDLSRLTPADAETLYKAGVEQASSTRGGHGGRGGRGGRGGGRGGRGRT